MQDNLEQVKQGIVETLRLEIDPSVIEDIDYRPEYPKVFCDFRRKLEGRRVFAVIPEEEGVLCREIEPMVLLRTPGSGWQFAGKVFEERRYRSYSAFIRTNDVTPYGGGKNGTFLLEVERQSQYKGFITEEKVVYRLYAWRKHGHKELDGFRRRRLAERAYRDRVITAYTNQKKEKEAIMYATKRAKEESDNLLFELPGGEGDYSPDAPLGLEP